jgi:hypothetical protein
VENPHDRAWIVNGGNAMKNPLIISLWIVLNITNSRDRA